MKYIIVLSFDLDEPEELRDILENIDPPSLPGFNGKARVSFGRVATKVEEWLDADG